MKEEIQYFNSHDAAKILGVNVSTIKRWTDEGKLECMKSAGGHRKFTMQHFTEFLGQNNKKTAKVNVFPIDTDTDLQISHQILKGDFAFLIDYVLEQAFRSDRHQVQHVLNGLYLSQYPLHEIFDSLITRVLYKIGELWENGEKTIAEEHIASQTIRDSIVRLQGIIRIPHDKTIKVLCLNLADELHDIALKMVDHILELKGFEVLYSGQLTPLLDLEKVFASFKPQHVYLSSTVVNNLRETQTQFDKLCTICEKYSASVFIGGRGFDFIRHDHPAVIKRFYNYKELSTKE
ncbi:MAG: helix-turn-helix domain-containing protein [Deferribacteres bacterium]|nr:helix-turn-helix domain-containing protein [candidate division KSB1 bacterium]MCB9504071.1 helix-turn-helix domain-containing protein [Deferribacteres bacterium]